MTYTQLHQPQALSSDQTQLAYPKIVVLGWIKRQPHPSAFTHWTSFCGGCADGLSSLHIATGPRHDNGLVKTLCRAFLTLMLLSVTFSLAAEPSTQATAGNSLPTTAPLVPAAANTPPSSAQEVAAHPFTPQQIETMRQTCRDTNNRVGPAMVVIKPGHYLMGSDDSDPDHQNDESPRHAITLPKPFAVSRCEITVGQFSQFVEDTHYRTEAEDKGAKGCYTWNSTNQELEKQTDKNWRNPGFPQSEQHPVVCVSWNDAHMYTNWLSQRSGVQYRLLSEAEWEYVARSGTTDPRFYGGEVQCLYANGADQTMKASISGDWTIAECQDGAAYTAKVAQYQPNAFGLFDVLGNVWEWTEDCWHDNYQNAPPDGSQSWQQNQADDCGRRVVRGGSWNLRPDILRSANRNGYYADEAYSGLGFRIARAL